MFFLFVCLLRLGKRTCLSSVCYRPSTESNVCPDQSTWPSRHPEIICSCNRRQGAPVVPPLRPFSAEFRSRQPIAGSSTPFSPRTVVFSLHMHVSVARSLLLRTRASRGWLLLSKLTLLSSAHAPTICDPTGWFSRWEEEKCLLLVRSVAFPLYHNRHTLTTNSRHVIL